MPDDIPRLIFLFFLFLFCIFFFFTHFTVFCTHFLQIFFKPERGMRISLQNYNKNKRTYISLPFWGHLFFFFFQWLDFQIYFFSFHFTSPFSGQKSRVSCYWCPRKRNWWFRATLDYLYTCMLVESWLDNFRCIEWQKETSFYRCRIIFHNFYLLFIKQKLFTFDC